VARALQTKEAKWYMTFARHPWVRSEPQGDRYVVELRDLQFSIDQALLNAVGFPERSVPFILRYSFSANGESPKITFNEKSLPR
jgi:hypothetical protein